jgi:hypothetical protein
VCGLLILVALTVAAVPAAAQGGFIEFLFGGASQQQRPPSSAPSRYYAYHPPTFQPPAFLRPLFGGAPHRIEGSAPQHETVRGSGGGGTYSAYCVRLCDGRYFPIQASRNTSAAQQCKSFCPASAAKVFVGNDIAHARAADGRRYGDLPTAFAYRKRLDPGCTCNGASPAGVAAVPLTDDATLRTGDVVATNAGFTVYAGRDAQRRASFTPINSPKVSQSLRNRLADVKVTPTPVTEEAPEPAGLALRGELSAVVGKRRVSAAQ